MAQDRTWRLGRRPELDGIRGVAILLVLACHAASFTTLRFDRFHALGSAGVEMFFALSGFLIMVLLLEEWSREGTVFLRAFFERRMRRLLPCLLTVVAFVAVARAFVGRQLAPSVWPALFYVANWVQIRGPDLGVLNTTWSLSIEEQFYLVCPLLLVASLRLRRNPMTVIVVGLVLSTAMRIFVIVHDGGGDRFYYGSDTQAGSLLVGCLLAVLAHRGSLRPLKVSPVIPAALSLAMVLWVLVGQRVAGDVVVPIVVPVLTAAIIWMACSSPGGLLRGRTLRYVGRRSYGLYLWHLPVLGLCILAIGTSLGAGLVAIAISFVVAEASWRLVESPFLRVHPAAPGPEAADGDLDEAALPALAAVPLTAQD